MKHGKNTGDRPDVLSNPARIRGDQFLELGDHVYDSVDDLMDVIADGKVSILAKYSTFKCYVEKRLCIHFHFGLWRSDGKLYLGDYCAIIQGAVTNPNLCSVAARTEAGAATMGLSHGEELVFISGVQFLKEPEMIVLRLRSLIRLNSANGSECVWMNPQIELSSARHLLKFRLGFIDGKQRVSVEEITPRQSPSNIVESGTRVVNTVTDAKCQFNLRDRFDDLQLAEIFKMFAIICFDKGVGVRVEKSTDFFVERTIMFFSPLDFVPTIE